MLTSQHKPQQNGSTETKERPPVTPEQIKASAWCAKFKLPQYKK